MSIGPCDASAATGSSPDAAALAEATGAGRRAVLEDCCGTIDRGISLCLRYWDMRAAESGAGLCRACISLRHTTTTRSRASAPNSQEVQPAAGFPAATLLAQMKADPVGLTVKLCQGVVRSPRFPPSLQRWTGARPEAAARWGADMGACLRVPASQPMHRHRRSSARRPAPRCDRPLSRGQADASGALSGPAARPRSEDPRRRRGSRPGARATGPSRPAGD